MTHQKIVITGVSAVCSPGNSFSELAANLPATRTPDTIRSFEFHQLDADYPCYRIQGYDPAGVLGKKGLRTKDWPTKVLLGTLETGFKEYIEGLDEEQRPGLCVGTAFGSVGSIGDFLSDSIVNGVNAVNPMAFGNTVINAPTGNANIRYIIRSLSATVATGFNAGIDAIIYACNFMRRGYLNGMLVAALEEISYYELVGMSRSGVLSASGSMRPFGRDADGLVVGEGCGCLLLETEESARSRGAPIIAEIAGTGCIFNPVEGPGGFDPDGESASSCVRAACHEAGIDPGDVDFVAANANGNPFGDAMEAALLDELMPGKPVTAYKIKTGECYGASGMLSTICAIADMKARRISGTGGGYALHDGVNLVENTRENVDSKTALVNSFSCDGNCSSIILKNII